MKTENDEQAFDEVLRRCHAAPKGRLLCMRTRPDHAMRCIVVDNAYFSGPVVAEGATWLDVLAKLEEQV